MAVPTKYKKARDYDWNGSIYEDPRIINTDIYPTVFGEPIVVEYDNMRLLYKVTPNYNLLARYGPEKYLDKMYLALQIMVKNGQLERKLLHGLMSQLREDVMAYNSTTGNLTFNSTYSSSTNVNTISLSGVPAAQVLDAPPSKAIDRLNADVEKVAKYGRKILAGV